MRDAYLEQNPDHKEEFEKHNNKNKDQLKKEITDYEKMGIWEGIVTVTGSWYRSGNVIGSSGVPTLKLLLCILKFHPASPVIAMDKLLRMEPNIRPRSSPAIGPIEWVD